MSDFVMTTDREVEFHVELDDGKYTYIRYKDGSQEALRNGGPWDDLQGDKFTLSFGYALERARAEAEHYKMLFVAGTSHFALYAPEEQRAEMRNAVVTALETIEPAWLEKYGKAGVRGIVLDELKKIGGQNG